jgi:hypothetical protein
VTRTRQLALLILLGVAVLVIAIIVFILNRSGVSDLLAVIGLLGGLAIIVTTLPVHNGNNKHD